MKLIVDSNRVIAGLIKNSVVRQILISPKFEFFAPDYLLIEIKNHLEVILGKSKLSRGEFYPILDILIERVHIIPKSEVEHHVENAKRIIGDVDMDDVPFIALALAVPNDGIWTEDCDFRKQDKIRIWSTNELMEILKK